MDFGNNRNYSNTVAIIMIRCGIVYKAVPGPAFGIKVRMIRVVQVIRGCTLAQRAADMSRLSMLSTCFNGNNLDMYI